MKTSEFKELMELARQVEVSVPNARLANYPLKKEYTDMIRLVVAGKRLKEIAEHFKVTEEHLKYELSFLYKIMGVKNRMALTRKFIGRV